MNFKIFYTIHPDVVQLNTFLFMTRLKDSVGKHKNSLRKILACRMIVILLFIVFCFQASAKDQNITLTLQNTSLEKVFAEIKKQTQYRFIYTKEELQYSKPVSISVKESKIEEVLSICFRDQPFNYKFSGIYIIVKIKQDAEINNSSALDVTGRITNENGEPLPGATITVRNSDKSVFANENGEFSLTNLAVDAVLVITNVGYEPIQYKLTGKSNIIIKLKPAISDLDEVTVKLNTGFQQIPKERVTGSFTFIDNKKFNQQVSTGIIGRLEAVTNGLYVDRSTTSPGLRIRGLSTIRGPKSPLIIVDNFPFEGDIENLNPNDVENITILKDAAAASIWGTKAGNGVIVITMKKGRYNQPITTEFNINTSFITKPDLWYQKQASASDYIDAEIFLFSKGFRFADTNNVSRPPFSPVYELLFKKRNGTLSADIADAKINQLRNNDVRNEFNKLFYQAAINQQYAFTTTGGTGNHSWLISAGVDRNMDNLNAKYNRATARLQNRFRLFKTVEFTAGITYSETNTASGRPGMGTVTTNNGLYPYAGFENDNGDPLPLAKLHRLPYIDTVAAGKLLDWKYYPSEDYKHVRTNRNIQNLLFNIGLDYKIVKGLSLNLLYQMEREESKTKSLFDLQSYYARDLINTFTQINNATGQVTYKIPVGGVYDLTNNSLTGNNFRIGFNYSKEWTNHNLTIIAGNEIRERKLVTGGYRTYGYNEDPQTSAKVDNINTYPSYITGSAMLIPDYSGGSFSVSNIRYVSFYGNGSYTFRKKYSFSLSGRKDASNQFGVSTNNKWTPLWSIGSAYKLSDEAFYKFNFLPLLNLRVSYGFSGNVNPSRFGSTTTAFFLTSSFTQSPIYSFSSFYDPELRWEKVGITNYGLDFATKKSRLKGSIEYYVKNAIDLFGTVPIDYTSGIGTTVEKNVAAIRAQGFDIELQALIINRKLKWTSDLNLNANRDRVTKYYLNSVRGSFYVGKRNNITGLEGKPVYSLFSYHWAGLDPNTGDPQGTLKGTVIKDYSQLTGNNMLITDLVYHGSVLPKIFGSWGHTISWNNISLTARLLYKFGHYFRRPGIEYSTLTTSTFQHSDLALRWRNPGDEKFTSVPSMPYPNSSNRDAFYLNSEIMVEKADHIRLQFVSLNYSIQKLKWKSLAVKKIDLYFSTNNLGLLWTANKKGIDPEYINDIPPSVSFAAGIRTTF